MFTSWAKQIAVAIGRPALRSVIGGVDVVATVAAIALLSNRGGLRGAAWGYVAAATLVAVLWMVAVRLHLRDDDVASPRTSDLEAEG